MILSLLFALLLSSLPVRQPCSSWLCRIPATATHNLCLPSSFLFHFLVASWDNPICLPLASPQFVSGINPVDQVDKDN